MPHSELLALARHGLVTAVVCCVIGLMLMLLGTGVWDVQLAYALTIGMSSWLAIDLGRLWLVRQTAQAWPVRWRGAALLASRYRERFCCGHGAGFLTTWQRCGSVYHGGGQRKHVTFFYQRGKAQHLQAQLEPHVLFNILANLRVLIATDSARAKAMLDLPDCLSARHACSFPRAAAPAGRRV